METEVMQVKGAKEALTTTKSVGKHESDSQARHRRHSSATDVISQTDEQVIARFGKKQRLKRRFKYLSCIGLNSSLMVTWMITIFTLDFGLVNGGPAGLVYGFLAAWLGSMIQALVLAELASMIPLSGGAFNWIAILCPAHCRKFVSYLAGWLTLIFWQVGVIGASYVNGTLIQGIISLSHPEYVPQTWHPTLLSYGVIAFATILNTVLGRFLPRLESFFLILYVVGFFAVLIPLAYLGPKRSAADVFGTFQNLGGWETQSLSFFVGWLSGTASFTGLDGSDHMAEEVEQASEVIPFSLWSSVFGSGLLGFGMLLATLFATQDFVAATESKTGFPFMDIFVSAMGMKTAFPLIILITIINVLSVSSALATASRFMWAFARENGIPFSSFVLKVNPRSRIPLNAIFITVIVSVLLELIGVGSAAAFNAFFSLSTAAYYSVLFIAAFVLLLKRLMTPDKDIPWGPFCLGRLGVPITVLSLIYTILVVFWSLWPQVTPVTLEEMNWASLMLGSAIIFCTLFWFFHGRHLYTGPIWELDEELTAR